jgi:hypothetical protein
MEAAVPRIRGMERKSKCFFEEYLQTLLDRTPKQEPAIPAQLNINSVAV